MKLLEPILPEDKETEEGLVKSLLLRPQDSRLRGELQNIYRKRGGPYQLRDWTILDYNIHKYSFIDRYYRGQRNFKSNAYFVVLGSAASFGATSSITYSELISLRHGIHCVNLGQAGAGFEFYLSNMNAEFSKVLDNAEFVIIEIMSPRSLSNSRFKLSDGLASAFDMQDGGKLVRPLELYNRMINDGAWDMFYQYMAENNAIYLSQMQETLARLRVPSFLLWFSRANPRERYFQSEKDWKTKAQVFPHFVDSEMFEAITEVSNGNICVAQTSRGESVALDRFSGLLTSWWQGRHTQSYYPSPGMHADAANHLEDFLFQRQIIK